MKLVMCLACGEFVPAVPDGDGLRPTRDACPACGGTRFKDNGSGRVVRTG